MEREESHSHLSGFLTRQQCTLMRGVAIICIILHNYIHNLDLSLEENEFRFYALKSRIFTDMLAQFGPRDWMQIISYLGHYGVPVFIFLSGFGLVKKYESPRAPQPSAARFIRFNYLKLLQLMLPVAIITLCLHPLLTPDQRITPAIVAGQQAHQDSRQNQQLRQAVALRHRQRLRSLSQERPRQSAFLRQGRPPLIRRAAQL